MEFPGKVCLRLETSVVTSVRDRLRNIGDSLFRVDLPLGSTEMVVVGALFLTGHWSLACGGAGSDRFQSPGCHLVDGDADHPEVVVNPGSATDNERPG